MTLPLALAGPAEGAIALAIVLAYGWLLIVAITTAVALLSRSRVAAWLAIVLMATLTALTTPWAAFRPVDSEDSDLLHFVRLERIFCLWWAVGVVAVIAAASRTYLRPAKPEARERFFS